MKKFLIPILLALIGVGIGAGAGFALRPDHTEMVDAQDISAMAKGEENHDMRQNKESRQKDDLKVEAEDSVAQDHEYVKLNNQFVIPIVSDELVDALVVLSLSIEAMEGETDRIYTLEPKLRDAFLQVLFDHANIGGFRGEFTNANNMDVLRHALTETAKNIAGETVASVLITDIARQDI